MNPLNCFKVFEFLTLGMRIPLVCGLLLLGLSACTNRSVSIGQARLEVHEVSVQELLGNAEFFDQQPVRVIGVARIDFSFEAVSALYTSKADMAHRTYSYVGLGDFNAELTKDKELLESLTGQFILVEGIFITSHRTPIDTEDDEMKICFGGCGASGYISQINRIDTW